MQFSKGHGTGNDFVILPDPDGQLALTPALVAAICDRRRGVGGDGVLRVVRAVNHPEAAGLGFPAGGARSKTPAGPVEWFMDYWNSDGSIGDTCGNGLRVFTHYLISSGLAVPDETGLPLLTRAGVVHAVVGEQGIAVDMGRPKVYGSSVATVGTRTFPGVMVTCGNPNLVCALPAGTDLWELDLTRAPGYDPVAFPAGANIEFVTSAAPIDGVDLRVSMRVYERGSAETLSCGSGACAVAMAALRAAGLDRGVVAVEVPGGRLTVSIDDESCWLAGPAVLVAHGELDLAAFPVDSA